MPPVLIFPYKTVANNLLAGALPGAWTDFHKSGCICDTIFETCMEKFIQFFNASKEKFVLLLVDGHATHVKNLKVIELAEENGVILCLSPHCTHRLQPFDVSYMKALSTQLKLISGRD